jgi:hypothetical protein
LKEVRRRAGAEGRPFREVLEQTIARGLATAKKKKARGRIRPQRIGLKAVYQKVSLNQLYDQLEAERTAAKPVN